MLTRRVTAVVAVTARFEGAPKFVAPVRKTPWTWKVETSLKLVNSACYDKQQVYAYQQPFSR